MLGSDLDLHVLVTPSSSSSQSTVKPDSRLSGQQQGGQGGQVRDEVEEPVEGGEECVAEGTALYMAGLARHIGYALGCLGSHLSLDSLSMQVKASGCCMMWGCCLRLSLWLPCLQHIILH